MSIIVILIILFLLFGGGGYYGYRGGYYGSGGFGGILGLLVILLILFFLFGGYAHAQSGNNPLGTGNFAPTFGAGSTISATTTSANVAIPAAGVNDLEIAVQNPATTDGFCRWGVGAQTATAADMFVPAGTLQVFYKGRGTDNIACLLAAGTGSIRFITGFGR